MHVPVNCWGPSGPDSDAAPANLTHNDSHYKRHGTCRLFVAVEPLAGFRFIQVRQHRTQVDDAEFMQARVDLPRYQHVKGFRLVQDHLTTHTAGSFYRTFEPEEARQLKQKFEYHYTPTNASWLNMTEIDLAAISKECLDRRIPERPMLEHETLACVKERNDQGIMITWRFTTNDARTKLKRHYTTIQN